jgi:general secretion pathway protein M
MLNNLSQREKLIVFSGAALVLLIIFWLGVLNPYREGVRLAESSIASQQVQLEEMRRLQLEYRRLQHALATAERRLERTARGFSLFSFIEEVTTRTGVRENLVSMRPQSPQAHGGFREESVEIRLERVQLEQLVRLLHAMESADVLLNLKSMRIKPRFDNRLQLDTILHVSYFQKEREA